MLLHCIKSLGLLNGFRYWRVAKRCAKDPAFARHFGNQCIAESLEEERNENWKMAKCLKQFGTYILDHLPPEKT